MDAAFGWTLDTFSTWHPCSRFQANTRNADFYNCSKIFKFYSLELDRIRNEKKKY